MDLKEPKRKRHIKIPQSQPFPVVIESLSGITACNSLWPVYIGTFSGDSVIVNTTDEMSSLYNMGFFGKGCLSRGYPNFGAVKNDVAPLITERQWKRRKLWIDQVLSFTDSSSLENAKEANNDNCLAKNKDSNSEKVLDDEILEVVNSESSLFNKSGYKSVMSKSKTSVSNKGIDKCVPSTSNQIESSQQSSSSNNSLKRNLECDKSASCRKTSVDKNWDAISVTSATITNSIVLGSNYDEDGSSSSCMSQSQKNTLNQTDGNYVVVVDDIGSDDECQPESLMPRLCNESIKTAVETLNLTLEEAFFLSFGLGCLQVVDLHGIFLSLQGMWHLYKESQQNFVSNYIAYHYFRSKGWIVKPGTKFGGDFLLYKEGPPFYHASYVVLIEEANSKFNNSQKKRQLNWTKILGLNRIVETANKEVLISQVIWPTDIECEELNDPRVIKKFKVQEVLLRRWNSSQQRDEKEAS